MIKRAYVLTMATCNQWIDARPYAAAGRLSADSLAADRNAFSGPIIGTLNHIVVGDTIWLKRFATHPSAFASLDPVRALDSSIALNQIVFSDLAALYARRTLIDSVILRRVDELSGADLRVPITYVNS